jgi:5-methylcytosine-specific restriction protein B
MWATLDVVGEAGALTEVLVLLLETDAQGGTPTGRTFTERATGRQVFVYRFPIAVARDFGPSLQAGIDRALEFVKGRFSQWKAGRMKHLSNKAVEAAVFDPSLRKGLLTSGLGKTPVLPPDELDLDDEDPRDFVISDPLPPEPGRSYSLESCADDLCADVETIQTWVRHIERKKQAVLYGPPGTGKTFAAQKLARHLVSGGDGFVELVQFHPAYAYEDFIQGLRPQARAEGGLDYVMVKGRFLEFCEKARTRKGRCVLILDEFNRANLARVLGELMYLLEYRDETAPLAGGGTLSIPSNVVILGTMNTADRSIALVDHALRRRFAFITVQPNYESLRRYHARTNAGFDPSGLIEVLDQVNREIGDPNYALGVSFFMHAGVSALLPDIWRAEIEPYLEEYFFDKPGTVSTLRWDKVKARILNQPAT